MANYVLTIELEGADAAARQIDSLQNKADKIPSSLVKFDAWGKGILRTTMDAARGMKFYEDAVAMAMKQSSMGGRPTMVAG